MPEPGNRNVARYLRVLLQEKLGVVFVKRGKRPAKAGGGTSLRQASKELDIKNLSEIVNGEKGVGRKVEKILADRWFGGSIDKLHEAADAWAEENTVEPLGIERVLAVAEELGRRGVVIPVARVRTAHAKLAAAGGEIHEDEIARALGHDPDEGDADSSLRKPGIAAVPKIPQRKPRRG